MATLRRADPAPSAGGGPLPSDIAVGPDPSRWDRPADWLAAGEAWARENLPAHERGTWRDHLPAAVRYAVSALGRAHAVHGGFVPPWEV